MFFLLRVAFWLSIVLVLMPSGKYLQTSASPQIGAGDAVSAATAAMSDMTGFCDRQPEACEVGGQAAAAFGQRAQAGAKYIFDLLHDSMNPPQVSTVQAGAIAQRGGKPSAAQTASSPSDHGLDPRAPLPPRDPRRPV